MKTVLLYATQHGTTETIAKHIQGQLYPLKIELINLAVNNQPDISNYETVILGSSIHAGKNQKVMQNFCKNNLPELLQKKVGLFLCCMNEGQFEQNIKNAYSEILRNHAFCIQILGGEYRLDKMNFIEKFLVKKIAGVSVSITKINYSFLNQFIVKIKKQYT